MSWGFLHSSVWQCCSKIIWYDFLRPLKPAKGLLPFFSFDAYLDLDLNIRPSFVRRIYVGSSYYFAEKRDVLLNNLIQDVPLKSKYNANTDGSPIVLAIRFIEIMLSRPHWSVTTKTVICPLSFPHLDGASPDELSAFPICS